ncbi:MAG: hypothetical protein K2M90_03845, partial [Treponemataceae bacterium]|nr:hypothetical protein [Treponemataceae bacterium]MDE7391581.1 hypothetical protein [Treponemataceae bacterium]
KIPAAKSADMEDFTMKKAKKMLLAASALALVSFGFGGCSNEEGGESDIITTTGSKTAIVDNYKNDTNDYVRGFKTINFEHSEVECTIVMENVSAAGTSAMGLVFGCSTGENAGKTLYNFYRIAVKNKTSTINEPVFYIDYIEGQPSDTFANGDGTYCKEVKGFTKFSTSPVTNGKLTVKVSVKEDTNGSLIVSFKNLADEVIGSFIEGTSTAKWTKVTEGKAGYYAMVDKNSTLKGSWAITNTKDAEIAEAE